MDTSVILLIVTKLLKLSDMTKPPLGKVEALLYVLQHVTTKGCAIIMTHPLRASDSYGNGPVFRREMLRMHKVAVFEHKLP